MFHSSVNIFGNSSNPWNVETLKKLLKIPQNQLNILNNIPGWTISEEVDKSIVHPIEEGDKNTCDLELTSENQKSAEKVVTHLVDLEKGEYSLSDNVLLKTKTDIFNKESSLVRASSLSSLVSSDKPNYSLLKQSSSVPDINLEAKISISPKKMSSASSFFRKGEIIREMQTCQFIESGVQCQMSQSSQLDLELPLSSRIELSLARGLSDDYETNQNTATHHEDDDCRTLVKPRSSLASNTVGFSQSLVAKNGISEGYDYPTSKKVDAATMNGESPVLQKETLTINVTDVDESFVSQQISCAQPLPLDNILAQKEYLPLESDPSVLPVADKVVKEIKHPLSKRKRKGKQEKVPKKFRGMDLNDIKILYSSDQIESMIGIMKVLNRL